MNHILNALYQTYPPSQDRLLVRCLIDCRLSQLRNHVFPPPCRQMLHVAYTSVSPGRPHRSMSAFCHSLFTGFWRILIEGVVVAILERYLSPLIDLDMRTEFPVVRRVFENAHCASVRDEPFHITILCATSLLCSFLASSGAFKICEGGAFE